MPLTRVPTADDWASLGKPELTGAPLLEVAHVTWQLEQRADETTRPSTTPTADGEGLLQLCTERLLWRAEAASGGGGYLLDYPSVALHAIARQSSAAGGRPALYCQLDLAAATLPMDEGDDEDEQARWRDLWLVPRDAQVLDTLYAVLSDCQSRHPVAVDADDQAADGDSAMRDD